MTRNSGGETINQGGAAKPDRGEPDEFDGIAGNARKQSEKPSPGDRDRGETSRADEGGNVADAGTARDRAG